MGVGAGRVVFLGLVASLVLSIGCDVKGQNIKSTIVMLPAPKREGAFSVEQAIQARRSVRKYSGDQLTLADVSQLLWSAQGITEPTRGLRAAPSAGARYPLEVYVAAGNVAGLEPGLYHYNPEQHLLRQTVAGDLRNALSREALGQQSLRTVPAVIAVAAVYGRTRARYGERGVRYADMEAGHAGQNVSLQAAALGLSTVMIGAFDDDYIRRTLQLPDDETPLYLIPVGRAASR